MSHPLDALLDAIAANDLVRTATLLQDEPRLATRCVSEDRLFEAGIIHWLYSGDTPLHLAAAGHRAEIVAGLLAAGADPRACENRRAAQPLHYAADGLVGRDVHDPARQVETIECLIATGVDIDTRDNNGATPLHRAVRTRSAAAVECLLAAGADHSARNNAGSTPFHLAVQNTGRGGTGSGPARAAQRAIIEAMLAGGADVNAQDGKRRTVLECAKSTWVKELLSFSLSET